MKKIAGIAASEQQDQYPTRGERAAILPRRDPIVYGRAESGPLNEMQLRSYEKNGYLQIPELFSAKEIAELTQEIAALGERQDSLDPDYIVREPGGETIRSFFHVHTYNPAFKALAAHPKVAGIARQILGSMVYIHQSRINLKPGFTGKEFYWHSDFETWHAEDGMPQMRALSCSINLNENTEHNGPLMVIPGSHRQFVACAGETPENHYKQSLRKQEYGVPDREIITRMAKQHGIASCKGKVGSVTFFDCNLLHGSSGNITPLPRNNIFIVYNSILNLLRDPYCGRLPRPEHIAVRSKAETL